MQYPIAGPYRQYQTFRVCSARQMAIYNPEHYLDPKCSLALQLIPERLSLPGNQYPDKAGWSRWEL